MNKNVQESRGIPPVRTWVVKFWKDGNVFHVEEVDTINKRFAYWMANENSGYKSQNADKVTVSLSKRPTYLKRNTNESTLSEKAVSKKQQKFMGMVYQCKKTGKCPSEQVSKAAKSMTKNDAKDFASTKHKGLPNKKSKKLKESSMKKEKRLMFEFINNICEKKYSSAKTNLVNIMDEKIKGKIKDIAKTNA